MTSTNYVCDSDYLLHKSKDFCKESQTPYFEKCRKIPEPNENHIIFNKAKDCDTNIFICKNSFDKDLKDSFYCTQPKISEKLYQMKDDIIKTVEGENGKPSLCNTETNKQDIVMIRDGNNKCLTKTKDGMIIQDCDMKNRDQQFVQHFHSNDNFIFKNFSGTKCLKMNKSGNLAMSDCDESVNSETKYIGSTSGLLQTRNNKCFKQVDNRLLEEDCSSKDAVKMYQTCVDNKEGDVSLIKYSNKRLKCADNKGNFIDCDMKFEKEEVKTTDEKGETQQKEKTKTLLSDDKVFKYECNREGNCRYVSKEDSSMCLNKTDNSLLKIGICSDNSYWKNKNTCIQTKDKYIEIPDKKVTKKGYFLGDKTKMFEYVEAHKEKFRLKNIDYKLLGLSGNQWYYNGQKLCLNGGEKDKVCKKDFICAGNKKNGSKLKQVDKLIEVIKDIQINGTNSQCPIPEYDLEVEKCDAITWNNDKIKNF